VSTPASPVTESPPDSEFDLDVRVAPVAQRIGREEAQRPTTVTCVQCNTTEFTCKC
jgi:hypothetical protein